MNTDTNCWVEVSREALKWNIAQFRILIGDDRKLMAVVKANAYGHGMCQTAQVVLDAGADWLGVFSVEEGLTLRQAALKAPVLVFGPCLPEQMQVAVEAGLRLTIASVDAARQLVDLDGEKPVVHLKIETGTNRQGVRGDELVELSDILRAGGVSLEGAYTHFADIEDTTDHEFAQGQLAGFAAEVQRVKKNGTAIPVCHTACSAATILFPETYFNMARVGIAMYGLWPSRETLVSAQSLGRAALDLKPAMSFKTRISQIKEVSAKEFVGYGRTFKTTRLSKIAILPVGYADGYPRSLSQSAHVLIHGERAPVRGRVCMNLTMVDVTDVPKASVGDEVVLLGKQGDETVSAEDLAGHAGTINYEIVTRIAPHAPRILV
jgi:alanine racemase